MSRPKLPSPAMVVACLALVIALGGTSYAAIKLPRNSVGRSQLRSNAVTSAKIKNGSVSASDLSAAALKPTSLYGDFTAAGEIQGDSQGLEGVTATQVAPGVYCMAGFATEIHHVVVSVDATGPDLGATAQATLNGLDVCPSTYQAEVQTYDGNQKRASEPFYVLFN